MKQLTGMLGAHACLAEILRVVAIAMRYGNSYQNPMPAQLAVARGVERKPGASTFGIYTSMLSSCQRAGEVTQEDFQALLPLAQIQGMDSLVETLAKLRPPSL